jgi:hypothetical protein
MKPGEIEEELIDIKRELDRRETSGAPTKENNALRERIAAIKKHLGRLNCAECRGAQARLSLMHRSQYKTEHPARQPGSKYGTVRLNQRSRRRLRR